MVVRPGTVAHTGRMLCPYADALALLDTLADRPTVAPDILVFVEHPPVITLGRKGGAAAVHARAVHLPGHAEPVAVDVWDIARGGSVTYHAPGQLVGYPVVQLARLDGPVGRGPLGDLPGYARLLEAAIQQACRACGVPTVLRPGFAGVWIDDHTKLASIGVGVRNGWTLHGFALNVCPHLEGFAAITPCGLDGVRMTSLWQQADERGLPRPAWEAVAAELEVALVARLRRRA